MGNKYTFHCDEPVWVESEWQVSEDPDTTPVMDECNRKEPTDAVEGMKSYYWISSAERDDVLAIPDFPTGEEVLVELEGTSKSFEEIAEERDSVSIEESKMAVVKLW